MNSIRLVWQDNEYWTADGGPDSPLHREDGPAAIFTSGEVSWYYEGNRIEFEAWCKLANPPPEDKLFLKLKYQIK